jgi:hypothetical protein
MRRWRILLIVIAVLIAALAVRKITQDAAKRKREIGYAVALKAYSQALHPRMTRKDIEEYLRSRNTQFSWIFTAFGGRRVSMPISSRLEKRLRRGTAARHMSMWHSSSCR